MQESFGLFPLTPFDSYKEIYQRLLGEQPTFGMGDLIQFLNTIPKTLELTAKTKILNKHIKSDGQHFSDPSVEFQFPPSTSYLRTEPSNVTYADAKVICSIGIQSKEEILAPFVDQNSHLSFGSSQTSISSFSQQYLPTKKSCRKQRNKTSPSSNNESPQKTTSRKISNCEIQKGPNSIFKINKNKHEAKLPMSKPPKIDFIKVGSQTGAIDREIKTNCNKKTKESQQECFGSITGNKNDRVLLNFADLPFSNCSRADVIFKTILRNMRKTFLQNFNETTRYMDLKRYRQKSFLLDCLKDYSLLILSEIGIFELSEPKYLKIKEDLEFFLGSMFYPKEMRSNLCSKDTEDFASNLLANEIYKIHNSLYIFSICKLNILGDLSSYRLLLKLFIQSYKKTSLESNSTMMASREDYEVGFKYLKKYFTE